MTRIHSIRFFSFSTIKKKNSFLHLEKRAGYHIIKCDRMVTPLGFFVRVLGECDEEI
jgi:hypothetical protein